MIRLDRVEQRRARQESQKQNVKQPMKLGGSAESPESRSESRAEEVKTKQSRAEERAAEALRQARRREEYDSF